MPAYGTPTRVNGLRPGQHRDSQRKRLYDADDVLDGVRVSALAKRHLTDSVKHSTLRVIRDGQMEPLHYPSIESAQDYVDAVIASAWFRRRWGHKRIPVQHSHGHGSAAWDDGSISLSVQHRRWEAAILHEIAHILTPHPYAHHGPEFAGILLTLVKYAMGTEQARILRESFREHRVRYTMAAVPEADERRKSMAQIEAASTGFKPRVTTRAKAAADRPKRKPPKRIETVEEMEEIGRRAARRGSDWDRAERAATARAVGDLRFDPGRRAFSRGFAEMIDAGLRTHR